MKPTILQPCILCAGVVACNATVARVCFSLLHVHKNNVSYNISPAVTTVVVTWHKYTHSHNSHTLTSSALHTVHHLLHNTMTVRGPQNLNIPPTRQYIFLGSLTLPEGIKRHISPHSLIIYGCLLPHHRLPAPTHSHGTAAQPSAASYTGWDHVCHLDTHHRSGTHTNSTMEGQLTKAYTSSIYCYMLCS